MTSKARYAIYFAPAEGSELERVCASILGRCARTGKILKQPELPGLNPSRLAELTASPRHYGLHGTLKPPFFLAAGKTEEQLLQAAKDLAADCSAFTLPPLSLQTIGSFLALTPTAPCPELEALARTCVTALDEFRSPAQPDELARRRSKGLTENQDRLLLRWGYPYVLEEFRFHLTLTGSIRDVEERGRVRAALGNLLSPLLPQTATVRNISVFRQPDTEQPFTLLQEIKLPQPGDIPATHPSPE